MYKHTTRIPNPQSPEKFSLITLLVPSRTWDESNIRAYICTPDTKPHTLRDVPLDGTVKESLPEGKRVKFNLDITSEADDTPSLATNEDLDTTGQDDVITPHCDTGIQNSQTTNNKY